MDKQTTRELMADLVSDGEIIDVDAFSDCDVEELLMPKVLTQIPQFTVEDFDAVVEDTRRPPDVRPSTPPNKKSLKRKACTRLTSRSTTLANSGNS